DISAPSIDRRRGHLEALELHVEIIERPFKDGRLDEEIKALQDKVGLLEEAIKGQTEIYESVKAQYQVGARLIYELNEAQVALYQAQCALIDGRISVSQASRKKDDLSDKVEGAKLSLKQERAILEQAEKALSISAPIAG